jgi:hypothetical protein
MPITTEAGRTSGNNGSFFYGDGRYTKDAVIHGNRYPFEEPSSGPNLNVTPG